jgi:ABC-2 type transport system permease protein
MTTTTAVLDSPIAGRDAGRRPSLLRLTGVELRKMVDTRAGFWLLVSSVLLTVAIVVARPFIDGSDLSLQGFFVDSSQVAQTLLPVVGILLVTSEWSQRTSLITFALVPRRARVLAAKLNAGIILAAAAWVVILAIAAIGTAFAGGDKLGATWSLPGWLIGQSALYLAVLMLGGIGLGAVLQSPAPAIVLYFLVPLGFAALGAIPALDGLARWLDGTQTLEPLVNEALGFAQWAHVGTTLAVWMALPIVVGLWRITRSEIN